MLVNQFESVINQGLAVSQNVSALIRESLQNDDGFIVEAWMELQNLKDTMEGEELDELKGMIASLRTRINRESKGLYGYAMAVKNGKLVKVTPKPKASKSDNSDSETKLVTFGAGESDFIKLAKAIEASNNDDAKGKALSALKVAYAMIQNGEVAF